jgi:hypothetical protein
MTHEDAPALRFARVTRRVARKPHACGYCTRPIPIGSTYYVTASMTEDDSRPHVLKGHTAYAECDDRGEDAL